MRKPRMIIFDDDTIILELLNNHFSRMNFEVQCFSEPILCRRPCENTTPCADIIITDFKMPRINGFELLNHQAQQGCTINIKNKAIVSGALPEEHIDKVSELAGTLFGKPFSLKELDAWTKECVSRIDLSQPLGNYCV
jgi:DNA-binding NtrC family response regulator